MHTSVLLQEVLSFFEELEDAAPKLVLDCTLGGGGHASSFLDANPDSRVIGLDCDEEAVARCEEKFSGVKDRVAVLHANFADAANILEQDWESLAPRLGLGDGPRHAFGYVFADLGFSSFQIESAERGLSFQHDGPLDMRLDRSSGNTAADILNENDERTITRILKRGGVGSEAKAVAREIVKSKPLETTADLLAVCERSVPQARRAPGRSPATTIFQAVRIEVNQEFAVIESLLKVAPELLVPKGRLAVISFHSLEDKLVARTMRAWQRSEIPAKLPVRNEDDTLGSLLTSSAVVPGEKEISKNPRARSARLRVFEMH